MKLAKRISLVLVLGFVAVAAPMAAYPYIVYGLGHLNNQSWMFGFMTGMGTTITMIVLMAWRGLYASLKRSWR